MTPRAVEWKLLLIIGKKPDYDDDPVPCNYEQQILEPSFQTMTEAEYNRPNSKLFSNWPSALAAEVLGLLIGH